MKRITPEMVVEAYRETGLKPMRRYMCGDGRACGLGVLLYKELGEDIYEGNWWDMAAAFCGEVDTQYVFGFAIGFDGSQKPKKNEACETGRVDGHVAWNAVVEAGLVGDAVE